MLSEQYVTIIGFGITSGGVDDDGEWWPGEGFDKNITPEVTKLERVARAAKDIGECLDYDEDGEVWTFTEKDDEDHKLWAALKEAEGLF